MQILLLIWKHKNVLDDKTEGPYDGENKIWLEMSSVPGIPMCAHIC